LRPIVLLFQARQGVLRRRQLAEQRSLFRVVGLRCRRPVQAVDLLPLIVDIGA
jgi:hypothetical protein